jgi:hypothetical protein
MTIRTALASRWLVVLWIIAVVGLPQVSAAAPVAKFTVTPVVEQAAAGANLVLCRGTANRHIASRGTANRGTANRGTANRGTANRGTAN